MAIVNQYVNDVHAAVIDGKTYVAIATDGGVSVINETDGTVIDYKANASSDITKEVFLTTKGELYFSDTYSGAAICAYYNIKDITVDQTGTQNVCYSAGANATLKTIGNAGGTTKILVTEGTSPFGGNTIYQGHDGVGTNLAGYDAGVTIIQEKQGDESNGSVKYITNELTSEEMVGDIRGSWSFDGSTPLTDNSIKTNDLTNSGSVTFTTDGVRGKAASFDGTNYLSVADNADLSVTGDLTVGAWINSSDTTKSSAIIYKGTTWPNYSYSLIHDNGTTGETGISFRLNNNAVQVYSDNNAIKANTWNYVVGVYDGSNLSLYLNGSLLSSVSYSTAIIDNNNELTMGGPNG